MSMASISGGYYPSYYQPAPYYYGYGQPAARGGGGGGGSRPSAHVFLLLSTLVVVATWTLYARCESAVESLLDQLRVLLILSPLLLIVGVQIWAASTGGDYRRGGGGGLLHVLAQLMGDGYQAYWESPYGHWHGAGAGSSSSSSPWGVALVLVLVLFLVSYQSSFQSWWFPVLSR